jgi:hypothetical protein
MKKSLLIISAMLLVASIFGVIKAYGLPTETTTTEETTLLEYQQQGEFSYLAYIEPSHLFGPEPQATSPALPEVMKYPLSDIDLINVTFGYTFLPDTPVPEVVAEVEVKATIRNLKDPKNVEITLLPKTPRTSDVSVAFPLDFIDTVTANNTEDILTLSGNYSGQEIIITAYVYTTFNTGAGPVFESYSQNLPIRANGPLVEIGGVLNNTNPGHLGDLNYKQQGAYSYEVLLKKSSPQGAITLKSPTVTPPEPLPLKKMSADKTIPMVLVNNLDMSFKFQISSDKPVNIKNETVAIEATLENAEIWSKTYAIIPQTNKKGDFTVSFPLDLKTYADVFKVIQTETGTMTSNQNLTLKATVRTTADTDYGTINTQFLQNITTNLMAKTLEWSDNLTKTQPGSIKATTLVQKTRKLWGMPVTQAITLLVFLTFILFAVFCFSVIWFFMHRQTKVTENEKKAREAQQKYKGIIINVNDLPEIKPGDIVVRVNSVDDLNKTAAGLLKPLLHKTDGQSHIYCVFDGDTRYEYQIE